MVYISTWNEFVHRAEDMVQQHPQKVRMRIHQHVPYTASNFNHLYLQQVRFVLRYKHTLGQLIAKVTDDVEVCEGWRRKEKRLYYMRYESNKVFRYLLLQCLQYKPTVEAELDKLLDLQGVIMASLTSPEAAKQTIEERETKQRKDSYINCLLAQLTRQ